MKTLQRQILISDVDNTSETSPNTAIYDHEHHERLWGRRWWGNLLHELPVQIMNEPSGSMLLCWSGSMSQGLTQADPRNWLMPGHNALREALVDIEPHQLILQPHRHHVLNDTYSTRTFADERLGQSIGVALSPATMLAPSMLADIEDHLRRMFESLGSVCRIVILTDVSSGRDGEVSSGQPLGRGMLPRRLVSHLLDDHVPSETPLLIQGSDIQSQLEWFDY